MRQAPGNNLCAYYICENIRIMTSERSKSERQLWVRLPEHYPQFFYHDLIYIHTTNIFILISFFKADGDAGQTPTNGSLTSNSRGNSGIFGRSLSRISVSFKEGDQDEYISCVYI